VTLEEPTLALVPLQGQPLEVLQEEEVVDSQGQAEQEEGSSLLVRLIRTLTSATFWHHALTQEHCFKQLQAWFHHHPLASCPLAWYLPPAMRREDMTSPARSSSKMSTMSSCQTSLSQMLL